MVDSRFVIKQYNELFGMYGQFKPYNMKIDEFVVVSSVIGKLPPSWKDFKYNLKHQNEELSLVQISSHICIEEFLCTKEIN